MWLRVLILLIFVNYSSLMDCYDFQKRSKFKFHLVKPFHRSLWNKLYLENVESLESCRELAKSHRGLALNYSPRGRSSKNYGVTTANLTKLSRDPYWLQPQLYYNCHILKCPENSTFKTLIADASFDYYSLYEKPIASSDYVCLPEVGLFVLHTIPENFYNASMNCRTSNDYCGSLAHVASPKRTSALTQLIRDHNQQQINKSFNTKVHLGFVGLYFNRSKSHNFEIFNMEKESLRCFSYRAWEPGNPRRSSQFVNSSCVALTTQETWKSVDCQRKLPYICEIFTACEEEFYN